MRYSLTFCAQNTSERARPSGMRHTPPHSANSANGKKECLGADSANTVKRSGQAGENRKDTSVPQLTGRLCSRPKEAKKSEQLKVGKETKQMLVTEGHRIIFGLMTFRANRAEIQLARVALDVVRALCWGRHQKRPQQ